MAKGRLKKTKVHKKLWKYQINIISTVLIGVKFQMREKDFCGQTHFRNVGSNSM